MFSNNLNVCPFIITNVIAKTLFENDTFSYLTFMEAAPVADPGFLEGEFKFTKGVRFVSFTQLFK